MSEADRLRWDERHRELGMAASEGDAPDPPRLFAHVEHLFPTRGRALEVACGRGRGVVWLARRGMEVWGVDVSPVAVELAARLAEASGVAAQCHLSVHDLDEGIPAVPPMDVVLCYLFRDERLDDQMMERVIPGGILAVAALSEVGVGPGPFRLRPGELREAFGRLEILEEGEAEGVAWLVGLRT